MCVQAVTAGLYVCTCRRRRWASCRPRWDNRHGWRRKPKCLGEKPSTSWPAAWRKARIAARFFLMHVRRLLTSLSVLLSSSSCTWASFLLHFQFFLMYMSQLLTSLSVLLDVHEPASYFTFSSSWCTWASCLLWVVDAHELAVYFTFSSEKSVSHAVAVFQQPGKGLCFCMYWRVLNLPGLCFSSQGRGCVSACTEEY